MAKLVNLNQHRKKKARADATTRASENVTRFGRTKSEKQRDGFDAEKAKRDLDGHKQDT